MAYPMWHTHTPYKTYHKYSTPWTKLTRRCLEYHKNKETFLKLWFRMRKSLDQQFDMIDMISYVSASIYLTLRILG